MGFIVIGTFLALMIDGYITHSVGNESVTENRNEIRPTSEDHIVQPLEKQMRWTKELNRSLLELSNYAIPDDVSKMTKIKREWAQLWPEYAKISFRSLKKHLTFLLKTPSKYFYECPTGNVEQSRRCILWNDKSDKILKKVYRQTKPYMPGHFERFQQRLRQIHSDYSDIKESINMIMIPDKEKHWRIHWTDELKSNLISCYYDSKSKISSGGHINALSALWAERYPKYAHFGSYKLYSQASKIIRQVKQEYNQAEESLRYPTLTNQVINREYNLAEHGSGSHENQITDQSQESNDAQLSRNKGTSYGKKFSNVSSIPFGDPGPSSQDHKQGLDLDLHLK